MARKLNLLTEDTAKSKEDYDELYNFIIKFFNIDILDVGKELDLEEVYTFLELEVERDYDNFIRVRQQLFKLIKQLFNKLEADLPDKEDKFNKNHEFNLLIKELISTDTIIVFNWDTVLDNLLERTYCIRKVNIDDGVPYNISDNIPHYKNYLLELSGFSEYITGNMGYSMPTDKGYILKLHGSIDWTYCKNEGCNLYQKVYPVLNAQETVKCDKCREKRETLFVPPVLNKPIRKFPFMRRLWNIGGDDIENATEMIIWGYSLPLTDFYSNWLLRRLKNNKTLKKLSLIDPQVIKKEKEITSKELKNILSNKDFIERFIKLLPNDFNQDNFYLYESFTDFNQRNTVENKYKKFYKPQ